MELIAKADVVLALGTRLNPFSTLPGYGIDYWPKNGEDHPGRHQSRPHRADQAGGGRHRRRREARSPRAILAALSPTAGDAGRDGAQGADRADQVGLAQAALLDGPRGRRSRHDLERARPRRQARLDEPAHGLARHPGGTAEATRSSRPTSATTARSATPIRRSRRAANIWRPACSGRAATACRRSSAPRSAAPTCRWSALPATAHSASP